MKAVLFALALAACTSLGYAREAAPMAADEQVEQRLVAISEELRCLVCQNESLAGSRADLAVDLRRQIREQIQAGKSDREIMDYMVARYGDFVRYRPPLKTTTLFLWFGPLLLLVIGIAALVNYVRRRGARIIEDRPLSEEERQRVARLLREAQGEQGKPRS